MIAPADETAARTGRSENRWKRIRLMLIPPALSLVLAGLGLWPTIRLAGAHHVDAMLLGIGIVLASITMWMGLARMSRATRPERFQIAMAAGIVRFFASLAVAGFFAWKSIVEPGTLLIWVAISYVLMIKVETLAFIHWDRQLENNA